jgi:hypothetical protein
MSVFFAGCASSWKVTGTKYKKPYYYFQPPSRWMIIKKGSSAMLSKHGPGLEKIVIFRHRITDTLQFTSLKTYPQMLPHELAEVLLSRIIAAPQVVDVCLLKEELAEVDFRQAIKLTVDYQVNAIGFRDIIYALIDKFYIYELRYSATRRHYFEENVETFETLVKSFRLR